MGDSAHWDNIYRERSPQGVSWYQDHPTLSLRLIQESASDRAANIIDIGGGASTLIDHLVTTYAHVAVVDISAQALEASRKRLGPKADHVTWFCGDLFEVILPVGLYDVWHDRALFHFLTSPEDRRKYVNVMTEALKPGGTVIIATFALDGPSKCSGLDVIRYSPETLAKELGLGFRLAQTLDEDHNTPAGACQHFVYCRFQKNR